MRYTVNYKIGWFWKKIKNVIADGYVEERSVRFFVLEDGSRMEVDTRGTIFLFDKERERIIKNNEERG